MPRTSHKQVPTHNQSKLFAMHEHDGNSDVTSVEYFPELPIRPVNAGENGYFGTAAEETRKKIEALGRLDDYLGHKDRARVINLDRMTEGHPLAKNFNLEENAAKAESILEEAKIYLLQACGRCALRETVECEIKSNIKEFVANHPTKDSRRASIDLNKDNPQISC